MSEVNRDGPSELSIVRVGEPRFVRVNDHLTYCVERVRSAAGHEFDYTYVYDDYMAAATVAMDRRRGERRVFLVKQERYPSQTVGWEIPAGRPAPGESQLAAARREAREEGGLEARLWQPLPTQVENVGRGNSASDIFLAADITEVGAAPDPSEVITKRDWFTLDQIDRMLLDRQISAGHTMGAILVAEAFLRLNPGHEITRMVT